MHLRATGEGSPQPDQGGENPSEPLVHLGSLRVTRKTSTREVPLPLSNVKCVLRIELTDRMEGKTTSVRVATYNVKGVLNPIKRSKILRKLRTEKAEIVYLQETHSSEQEHGKLKRLGFDQVFSSSYKPGRRRGVATLISAKLTFEKLSETKDKEGRYNMVIGRIDGVEVTLLNVYVPPGAKWAFYKHIFDLMITKAQGIIICGGDFNLRLNPTRDASGVSCSLNNSLSRKMRGLCKEMGICDVWREFNPTKRDYTFFSAPHSSYSRIDYFFMFNNEISRVRNCKIGLMDLSDHSPVYMDLDIIKRVNSFSWKLNSNVLRGPLKQDLQREIQIYLEENDNGEVSPPILWDACKAVIRGKIIAKLALQKKIRREKSNNLESELYSLEQKNKHKPETETTQKIKEIRNQINELYRLEIQKKLTFIKQQHYEIGSKSSKFLAYKLRKHQTERVIVKIKDPITKQEKYKIQEIQNCFEEYYRNLYLKKTCEGNISTENLLNSLNLPKISDEQNTIFTVTNND